MKFLHARSPLISLQVILFLSLNLLWLQTNASGNETDRIALLKFKEGITSDPHGILNSWNDSIHFCNWFGITCGRRHQRVTSLVLQVQNLFGVISPHIGNLSFIRYIDLQNNSLHGEIPKEVGNLFRLQKFILLGNSLEGEIPFNLSHCSQLRVLRLSLNSIGGKIPAEIGSLIKLEELRLGVNYLTGEIPPSLCNLSSLSYFSVTENNLGGRIPDEIGQLKSLTTFGIGVNKLSGTIPTSIFNISSIKAFSTIENQLNGGLPNSIGLTLPSLRDFGIYGNKFSGKIPNSLSNASQLQLLDIGSNNFVGHVPTNLGSLQELWWLGLGNNSLGSCSPKDLAFLLSLTNCSNLQVLSFNDNHFGGVFPKFVSNLSIELSHLYIGGNCITGIIHEALENLINLILLEMQNNLFAGAIPSYFGKFQKLQRLALNGNRLSGQIPSSIGNLSQLLELDLSQNSFEGSIPSSVGNCQNLYYFDVSQNNLNGAIPLELLAISSMSKSLNLSQNSLTGNLPAEVGKLIAINKLDISENGLSGEIPITIRDCMSLEYLYMQGNSFKGVIPSALASLRGLRRLDVSRNGLIGEIPQDLQNIKFLEYLNLSFNDLEGDVPARGVFQNASAVSLTGNSKLCGGAQVLHLPKCPARVTKKGNSLHAKRAITIFCISLCVLSVLACLALSWIRRSKKNLSSARITAGQLAKVSYKGLYQATCGFSSSNIIGSGSFGTVYRGLLDQAESPVAIKVLNLQRKGASKSFIAECRALSTIRHRNLVKILTYCSSLDYKGNDFKALVFEFMENGSLETWLHPDDNSGSQIRNLDLLERLNIAIDVASAFHYLHDLYDTPIIHCDLKPSNVLLDDDMIAHISDFGLARLPLAMNDFPESQTSTSGIKGTIGYVAPEYGMGAEASKEGDEYSYGILLLEMLSGRRPTDEMFNDDLDLHDFVKAALPERLVQVVDPTLLRRDIDGAEVAGEREKRDNDKEIKEEAETNDEEDLNQMETIAQMCLLSLLEIGVACSAKAPRDRMNMKDVIKELHAIKESLLNQ